MGGILVVTTFTLYLNITTQNLQHDGRHVGSYHVDIITENYYKHLQHDGCHVGSYHVDINLKITKRHLQHDGRHVGSYHVDIIPSDY
jgi:hypothetical protein